MSPEPVKRAFENVAVEGSSRLLRLRGEEGVRAGEGRCLQGVVTVEPERIESKRGEEGGGGLEQQVRTWTM